MKPINVRDPGHALGLLIAITLFAGAAVLALAGCQDTPTGPQLAITLEEVPVDCETIDRQQAEQILKDAGVWDHLLAQRPPPDDDAIVEAAKLVCTGGVVRGDR